MKTLYRAASALLGLIAILLTPPAPAAGLLRPVDGSLPPLKIQSHLVDVTLRDGYAVTQVEQVFANPNARDLEALYAFPVPDEAAVSEFTYWIDGKPVDGEVLEKKAARAAYEEEKAAGHEAGLTEKQGYQRFEVRVAPVRAGKSVRVRLVYLQPLSIDTGIGRYVYPLEDGGTDEQALAFWTADEQVQQHFRFDLRLHSAVAVDAVRMPKLPDARISQQGPGEWRALIERQGARPMVATNGDDDATAPVPAGSPLAGATPPHAARLDRDLVFYWRLKPGLPASVDLVAHRAPGKPRGTFLLTITPGADLAPISTGRDWLFVLDISGSMRGKYATLADGIERALKKLRPGDRFRLVTFNRVAAELTHGWTEVTPETTRRASARLRAIQPHDGTNLYAGLQKGLTLLDADRVTGIVLVSDGVANVGQTGTRDFLDLLKRHDARLFTFIMGNGANRPLLKRLTEASNGFAIELSNSDDIAGKLLEAASKVSHQAMHDVELRIDGVKTADLTPARIGTLYRGEQLTLLGHYFGAGEAQVTLKARISGQAREWRTRFVFPATASDNPELERLWAFARIEELQNRIGQSGKTADLEHAVIDLGTEYGLVTDYTSMVVMRDERFAARAIERRNQRRIGIERAARQRRRNQGAPSRRVDQAQPMFHHARPSFSGGGALDWQWLALSLPLLFGLWRARRAA